MHSCYFAINAILLLLNYIVVLCTPAILLLMLFCYSLLLNYYSHIVHPRTCYFAINAILLLLN